MSLDKKAIIDQIDSILDKSCEYIGNNEPIEYSNELYIKEVEILTLLAATIDRLAPPGSRYQKNSHDALERYVNNIASNITNQIGILKALKSDYEAGHLEAIHELIHADVFADFLEMADYLLEEGYKDPAAVFAGGVIEEHLRKLCQKNIIEIMKNISHYRKADSLNAELAGANVYSKLDQKSVTAWLDLRNKAAHGKYDEYTKDQVALMVQSILDFISRNPA